MQMDPRNITAHVYSTLLELERDSARKTDETIEELALLAFDALDDARADGDTASVVLYDLWLRAMQHTVDNREVVWAR